MQNIYVIKKVRDFEKLTLITSDKNIYLTNTKASLAQYGVTYFCKLAENIKLLFPQYKISFIIDADDNPFLVRQALREGFKFIIFKGNNEILEKLSNVADNYQAEIISNITSYNFVNLLD